LTVGRGKDDFGVPNRSREFAFTAFVTENVFFFDFAIAVLPISRHFDVALLGYSTGPWEYPESCEEHTMEERDFFDERPELRTHNLTCPHCNQAGEYQLNWLVRRKKQQLPRGADEIDRARFAKAKTYMVRRDDLVGCKNIRCRKRFEVIGIQSVATQDDAPSGTVENRAERLKAAFGRRSAG
jgi:hypothetical protein